MKQYLNLMENIISGGHKREDRTGTGTIDFFGPQMRFDLRHGFPILTTKKVNFEAIAGELIWILRGLTSNHDLRNITYGKDSNRKTIWEPWAHSITGELGKVYGHQLRHYFKNFADVNGFDQLENLIDNLSKRPFSRRHVISFWNPHELPDESKSHDENISLGNMVLPPCHCLFQFHVHEEPVPIYEDGKKHPVKIEQKKHLSCKLYQRSADFFIGVPFNISSYALLTHIIANHLDMIPCEFIHTFGSAHIYLNHRNQVDTQLQRTPGPLPKLIIHKKRKNIWEHEVSDFQLKNYQHQGDTCLNCELV